MKLTGKDEEVVKQWLDEIIIAGRNNGKNYGIQTAHYWLREFVPIGSDEYYDLRKTLDEVY